jgi:hypothetical protein
MACEIEEVQDAAKCLDCLSEKELLAIMAWLACQWVG